MPSQPAEDRLGREFECNDTVDAFVNGAWWEGTVNEEVKGGAAYLVYFKSVGHEFGFAADELRLYREWIDGRGVLPFDGADLGHAEAEAEEEEDVDKFAIFNFNLALPGDARLIFDLLID